MDAVIHARRSFEDENYNQNEFKPKTDQSINLGILPNNTVRYAESEDTTYIQSLYWASQTLCMVGEKHEPKTDIRFAFSLIAYFLGMFVFAIVVGQIGSIITNSSADRVKYERLVDNAKVFMKNKSVPITMRKRVLQSFFKCWLLNSTKKRFSKKKWFFKKKRF